MERRNGLVRLHNHEVVDYHFQTEHEASIKAQYLMKHYPSCGLVDVFFSPKHGKWVLQQSFITLNATFAE